MLGLLNSPSTRFVATTSQLLPRLRCHWQTRLPYARELLPLCQDKLGAGTPGSPIARLTGAPNMLMPLI
jgi:hypothetical protein